MSKLKDLCLSITDGEHGTVPEDTNGTYYFLNNNNITENGIVINSTDRRISAASYDKIHKRTMLSKNDVVIATCGTLGKVQVITDEVPNYEFSRSVGIYKCNQNLLLPYYLYYALISPVSQKKIKNVSKGGNQKHFYIGDMEDFELDIPNIEEQQKIIDLLKPIDDKIANNNAISDQLESLANTIYDYWFLQFEFPNEEGKPYKSSGGKMVWNEELKREIPEGWEARTLDTLCTFGNGINYDKGCIGDKEYKIVNVRNITASSLLINSCDLDHITLLSKQADKYIVNDNDILIARSGTPGAVRLLLDNENTIYCGFIIHCLPINSEHRLYLTYAIKQFEGSAATTTGGSILQNVSQDTLKSLNIIAPPIDIIKKFNKTITIYIDRMQQLIKENQQLTSLRDFLLPLLMNGQVTIQDAVKITEKY